MLLPLSDFLFGGDTNGGSTTRPTFHHNITMLAVVLLVMPLCTLQDLTPLKRIGALSMASIFTVACCIACRSIQCDFSPSYDDVCHMPWYEYLHVLPPSSGPMSWSNLYTSFHELLNATPVLISMCMCHFNVLPVHNELKNPTHGRVRYLFSTSIYGACAFYLFVGFARSMYGNCTKSGKVEGNVLLSFDEGDTLIMVGRACLSLTIAFAFSILVVPCRDVVLRACG